MNIYLVQANTKEGRYKMPNQHKQIQCEVCEKWMRKDKLKSHSNVHKDLLDLPEEEIKTELKRRHDEKEERKEKRQKVIAIAEKLNVSIPDELISTDKEETRNIETLRQEMMEENRQYIAKIELGKTISSIIDEENIHEQSLNKEKQEALHLYRRQQPQFTILDVELRAWQQDAMKYFESPTKRQVIWICGNNGNEGKTWFQNYVQTFYGYHRVCKLDLRIKHANICNVLKKQTLGTIDIFLFNDSRSVSGEDLNLYRILEDIKDGQATSSKYDNDNIRFKTPNTLMVFSNTYPNLKKLSKDRWLVCHPNKDGLKVVDLKKK